QYWHASEHLQFGSEWMAAFDDNSISIDVAGVFPTDSVGVDSLLLYCPDRSPVAGAGDPQSLPGPLQLSALRPRRDGTGVGLRLELPRRTAVRLAVYDVAGRRLTTLVDGELPAGRTDVPWSGVGEGGTRFANGMYFVRLNCSHGNRAAKVLILR